MILQFSDALTEPACQGLVEIAESLMARSAARGEVRRPATFLFDRDMDRATCARVLEVLRACVDRIATEKAPDTQTLYVETIALTVLGPGESIPWHADNCRLGAQGQWEPNEYPQRSLSAVAYLNGGFEGGEIVFDQQGLEVKPRAGLLIVFPSGHRYPHRVMPVHSGKRYALGLWFTVHRWHALLPERIPFRWAG